MENIKVSLFASAVRPQLWPAFFKSLQGTSVIYEVVFAGNVCNLLDLAPILKENLTYISTENIKPAQCYEIARRHCKGETVIWCADDCLFPDNVVGKAYEFWKAQANEKLIISMLTHERYRENYFITDLNQHTLKGTGTSLMAPIGMMSKEYLDNLGGFDRRFICGQYENMCVKMILQDGGTIQKFEKSPVLIDHFKAHGGVGTNIGDNRPFAKGYPNDRKILEGCWINNGKESMVILDKFEPYEDIDILIKSQSNNLPEMWI